MIGVEQIKQLQQRAQVLGRCIDVDAKRAEVASKTDTEPASSGAPMFAQKKCCSDIYQQIEITGSSQNSCAEQGLMPVCLGYCADLSSILLNPLVHSKEIQARALTDLIVSMAKLRPLLSIWRI